MPVWVGSRRIASLVGRKVRFVAARPAIIIGGGGDKKLSTRPISGRAQRRTALKNTHR